MKKTIRVKADTLKQARAKFDNELPQGIFILKIKEYDAFEGVTNYYIGESEDKAVETAKTELPEDPFYIKGDLFPETVNETNKLFKFNIQAESDMWAEMKVKNFIGNKYYPNTSFYHRPDFYSIYSPLLIKKGFKGVLGVGKIENTYEVTVYIWPKVRIKYSSWAVVEAEITDEIYLANKKLLEVARYDCFDSKGIERLISQGVDIHYNDEHGRNVLFYSCHDYKISKLLIDKGVDYIKTDNVGDNILTYCLRNDYGVHYKIKKFLENNGIEQDKALLEEIIREAREAERRKIENSKSWCSKCNKNVFTVDENHKYYDDGWMEEVDIKCRECGTLIEHYSGQTR